VLDVELDVPVLPGLDESDVDVPVDSEDEDPEVDEPELEPEL
jgi:hypothetical protein